METRKDTCVLIVDDEEEMVTALSDVLSLYGYTVETAGSGEEAVVKAGELRPDCILMDIRMSGIHGVDAFREIKQISPESFVIFMTGYSSSTLIQEARDEGALEVFPKPLDLERVVHLIEKTASKTSVLVVDDDIDFCASLADSLAMRGFEVRTAQTFDEAVRAFEREPRRVVVLDVKLGERSGLEAMLIFRDLNPRTAVLLMTGLKELAGEVERGLEMKAYACLWKPFEVEELVRLIHAALAAPPARADPP